MARKGFDELWMPFAELAVGTTNPLLGAGLAASRIAANNARSQKSRDNAGGVYFAILALAVLALLSPPDNQPPQ